MTHDEYDHLRESADAAAREPLTIEREAQQAIADGYVSCRACLADGADIGTFDHGIAHNLDNGCKVPRALVDECRRTGNHAFHKARE